MDPFEAELEKWIGVIERHPEVYLGEKNDLSVIPKDILPALAKKFKEVKAYLNPTKNLKAKIGMMFNKLDLAAEIIKEQPCYFDKSRNWWLWNLKEFKWVRVDETDILISIEEAAEINTINSKEKTEMIEALKQVSRKNKPLDIDKNWVQFKDKIINIKTGETMTATPKYFVTNPIPWELHEDNFYETPEMDRIFEEWVGKDHVQTLYEILAYSLLPAYPINRIFLLP